MKKRSFILVSLLTVFIFISMNLSVIYGKSIELPEEESAFIIENTSQDIIFNQGAEEKINPAELNQLMAVLVSLDVLGNQLSEKVTVGSEINNLESAPSLTGFEEGQEVSYQDLLYSILLSGSYDATAIMANNVGLKIKDNAKADGGEGTAAFIQKMNDKAKELGLKNTNFSNPFGYNEEKNYSTIQDLTLLTQNALNNETVKRIISSDEYSIKLNSIKEETSTENESEQADSSKSGSEQKTKTAADNIETLEIPVTNQFLSLFSSDSTETSNNESESKDENKSEEVLTQDEEVTKDSNETLKEDDTSEEKETVTKDSDSENKEKQTTNKKSASTIPAAFVANLNSENSIVAFESDANDAQVIGCITGAGAYTIADEVNTLTTDIKSDYIFKDLTDETGNLGTYKLNNTSLFSKKKMDLTSNTPLKAYVPKDTQDKIKTNIVWDKNIANQENNNLTLVQSVEPGTQVAQLEISKGDVKRLVPLYSATKANVKSWIDSVLTFLIWFSIIAIILLIVWRLIYVRNRRRVLAKKRALKRKRQRRIMQQREKQQQVQYSSPIERMAH